MEQTDHSYSLTQAAHVGCAGLGVAARGVSVCVLSPYTEAMAIICSIFNRQHKVLHSLGRGHSFKMLFLN